jgi:hypothetical protein
MPIPTAPTATDAPKTVTSAPVVAGEKKTVVMKQFGPAKDDAGNDVVPPAPLGVNLVELCKSLYNFTLSELSKLSVDPEKFVVALDINKETVPGHKNGRAAYATANAVASLFKHNGLLNKERGAGGYAKLKDTIQKKDSAIEALKARLLAMKMPAEEIEAILASAG